jgi:hypothetical protein
MRRLLFVIAAGGALAAATALLDAAATSDPSQRAEPRSGRIRPHPGNAHRHQRR